MSVDSTSARNWPAWWSKSERGPAFSRSHLRQKTGEAGQSCIHSAFWRNSSNLHLGEILVWFQDNLPVGPLKLRIKELQEAGVSQ